MSTGLLLRIAQGDRHAFKQCIDRYGAIICGLSRRLSSTPADAEDATQEVFLHLWRNAGQYDAARGPESLFILTLARRILISRYRSNQRRPREVPVEELAGVDWEPVTAATTEDHLEARLAAQALATLPADQRRVIEMSVVNGLSQSEIALHTGLPLGTVKTFMRRGLMLVRDKLNQQGAGRHTGVGA